MKRKLFKILSGCLLVVNSYAQTPATESKLIGPISDYRGFDAGLKIPFLECLSADAKQTRAGTGFIGRKYPLIIGGHGIGEKTTSFPTMPSITTADLWKLFNTSLPSLVRYTNSQLYNRRYAQPGSTDSTSFCYLFPQGWQGSADFYPTYAYHMIKYAKDSLADIIDTNRIYLTGLSWGGGFVMLAVQDTIILKDIAGAWPIALGYFKVTRYPYNFKALSEWGGFFRMGHSLNDSVTVRNPTTKAGCYLSDLVNDSLLKYKNGRTIVVYDRWVTGGHNFVWDRVYNLNNSATNWDKTNGQTVNYLLNMHTQFLMFNNRWKEK
jgi:hypothetical protein